MLIGCFEGIFYFSAVGYSTNVLTGTMGKGSLCRVKQLVASGEFPFWKKILFLLLQEKKIFF